jgi:hypothetical protein
MLSDLGQLGLASVGICGLFCLISGSLMPVIWVVVLWCAFVYSANYVDKNAS